MKCAMIKGVKLIETSEINEPQSGKGNVIVDIKKAGICGSDIHNWDLGAPEGLVMGHEFCGVVTDPGARDDLKVGDRVTALPISPCRACPACDSGNYQYCPQTWAKAVGLSLDNPGAYAPKCAIRPDMVVKVPDSVTDNEVAMIEPAAVALHAVHLADLEVGNKVLVIGAGVIGDLCALFAKLNGASYVAVSETNEKRGEKSVKLNCADEWFNAKDANFMQNVLKECPYGYDVVIDCSGNSAAVTTALATVRPNGCVVLVGVSVENISIPSALLVTRELKVYGAIAYTVQEFRDCIDLIYRKRINVEQFVDDVVSIDEVQRSFERLTCGTDDAIKILIDPNKN
ncbi:MAG: alcohol dehydrogenase catalytic domain-containing protein [Bacilli bacterium]|nr:alcohol dehydrogenase catalytic domain-containing protein [Bacilli bacterium]